MTKVEEILAKRLERTDWHKLNSEDRKLVTQLEESGHLERVIPPDGFVGRARQLNSA
jgi:hypothetical protein